MDERYKEKILELNNFKTAFNLCYDAHINHKMLALIGAPGYGKTTTLNAFKKKYGRNVQIITARRSQNAKEFYSKLGNLLSDNKYLPSLSKAKEIELAAEAFLRQKENMLLIIDEANKFSSQMLEYLHEFRDMTKSNTGIVLSGTLEFRKDLNKWIKLGKSGVPEFYRRIENFQVLYDLTEDEIVSYIESRNIFDKKFTKSCLTSDIKSISELNRKVNNFITKNDLEKVA